MNFTKLKIICNKIKIPFTSKMKKQEVRKRLSDYIKIRKRDLKLDRTELLTILSNKRVSLKKQDKTVIIDKLLDIWTQKKN